MMALLSLAIEGFGFVHPGALSTKDELDFVKGKIQAGASPWITAFNNMKKIDYGSLSYTPHPAQDVGCGSYSNPDIHCNDEWNDAKAAYTQALLWYYSGNEAYAKKSVEIMNGWSAVLKTHSLANTSLQCGWVGTLWARAAEIIRYSYPAWSPAEVQQFKSMLNNAYVPYLTDNWCHNVTNWELSFCDALIQIAVFTDNQDLFNYSVTWAREWFHAAFYMSADGSNPYYPTGPCKGGSWSWFGLTAFKDGVAEETCRDFTHLQYGLSHAGNICETAYHQGVDLYSEFQTRLVATYEFHAGLMTGDPKPSWLCALNGANTGRPTWEIVYNHYHNRMGVSMPKTLKMVTKMRGSADGTFYGGMAWEAPTHEELGAVGLTTSALDSRKSGLGRAFKSGITLIGGDRSGFFRIGIRAENGAGIRGIYGVNGMMFERLP